MSNNSIIVLRGTNDEWIYDVINKKKVCLDKKNVEIKRYSRENIVGRQVLKMFVGAMENVKKLKLIDGDMLADLMVKHEVDII